MRRISYSGPVAKKLNKKSKCQEQVAESYLVKILNAFFSGNERIISSHFRIVLFQSFFFFPVRTVNMDIKNSEEVDCPHKGCFVWREQTATFG